jgi:homogentisate 1,2-dioxygenase
LYAEQLSGTAFTAPRARNRRSWLYWIRPAAVHKPFTRLTHHRLVGDFSTVPTTTLNQLRWDQLPMPDGSVDFVDSLVTMTGNGSVASMSGCAIHLYAATASMRDRFFYSADGELRIVPQQGRLTISTELGVVDVRAVRNCGDPARRAFLGRATGPGTDRLQRSRESARLPDALGGVRRS